MEVEEVSAAPSPSTGIRYGISRVCRLWEVARSGFYAARKRRESCGIEKRKTGPKTAVSDQELVAMIQEVVRELEQETGLRGEGHRKVRARLRARDVHVGRERVLRLMRENSLLAPTRVGRERGPRVHDGTITMPEPDLMWGTDATMTWTREEGLAWIFVAVDHCTSECIGIHASRSGNRFEALEPVRQGVREHFGEPDQGVALGLGLRHDWGSAYASRDFQQEIDFLGICSSPSFVRAPEGNGVAERFIRTLKEQLLWVKRFDTVEDLRLALLDFKAKYNQNWLVEKHGYLTPAQIRSEWKLSKAA